MPAPGFSTVWPSTWGLSTGPSSPWTSMWSGEVLSAGPPAGGKVGVAQETHPALPQGTTTAPRQAESSANVPPAATLPVSSCYQTPGPLGSGDLGPGPRKSPISGTSCQGYRGSCIATGLRPWLLLTVGLPHGYGPAGGSISGPGEIPDQGRVGGRKPEALCCGTGAHPTPLDKLVGTGGPLRVRVLGWEQTMGDDHFPVPVSVEA